MRNKTVNQHTIITGSIALLITASAFAGTPEKNTAPAPKPKSYYRAPSSYSTTRDPDVPKYAKPAPKTGASFLRDAHWLDIGLDYRLRAEYRDGDIRRDAPAIDEPLLHRTRGYIGIRDILDPFRFAFEFQDSRRTNGEFPKDNRDFNDWEPIRLYAELYFDDLLPADPAGNPRPLSLRYGIHNFELLDRRLIGNNQWRNTANTFQGFRGAIGEDANNWSIDLFALQPLNREISSIDTPVEGRWIYGAVGHWREWSDIVTIEPFYLAMDQDRTAKTARKTLHSPGLRAYGVIGKSGFDFDGSIIRQFGQNGTRDIDAWGGNIELGYKIDAPWKPRISAFYGYASGDKNPADGEDNRFERFYGFGRPWSANDYIVFENIEALKLRVELQPHEKLRTDFGFSWYTLASARDRFAGNDRNIDRTGKSGTDVGTEFDIRARWQIHPRVEAILGYSHFWGGDFTTKAIRPGDTDFFYLELTSILF